MFRRCIRVGLWRLAPIYNALLDVFRRQHPLVPSDNAELSDIRTRALTRTDISDHLVTLFVQSLFIHQGVIVELGVRGGESTFVLERVAKLTDSALISVDIDDCSAISTYDKWHFIQEDDITFAKRFKSWCAEHAVTPKIDVLFIDTSHSYTHTLQEIKYWFPFLSPHAKVFFHDTNVRNFFYIRRDGSLGVPGDEHGGVMTALSTYFQCSFDEQHDFVSIKNNWLIKHNAGSNGFTILERHCCLQPDERK